MKRIILRSVLALAFTLASVGTLTANAYAAPACGSGSTSKDQVLKGLDETGSKCDDSDVKNVIAAVVNILSFVVGVAAVFAIILSGFKYITSGGEANKVANAKSTLIYALIGLAIAALAQFLVHFVLTQATAEPCPTNNKILKSNPACKP